MFIVLEGLDGAGKSTQIRMLRQLLAERGVESEYVHFPRFDAPVYGELIARFLRGEFGGVNEVDPYLVALLFAGDRAAAGPQIRAWIAEGKAVVLDRYVYSNVGFQCAKLPAGERRDRLAQWTLDLEFGYNDLDYLQGSRDIHEDALDLQRRVREVYLAAAAKDDSLRVVDCSDPSGAMGSPEHNFEKIRAVLAPILDAR